MSQPKSYARAILLMVPFVFLSGCLEFKTIDQPASVLQGESFKVRVKVWTEGGNESPYCGICLPRGWVIVDNTVICTGVYGQRMEYNADLSLEQEALSPAPEGYYWWVADGNEVGTSSGTVVGEAQIQTDVQSGLYRLDYMLGDSFSGLNHARSDNHVIHVLDEYDPRDLQTSGQKDVVSLSWLPPFEDAGLIGYHVYRDERCISTHPIEETLYADEGLAGGVLHYSVSSVYDDGSEHLLPYAVRTILFSGGTGQSDDPYQIATAADLLLLAENADVYQEHFVLTADIDLDPNLPGRRVFDRAVIAPDVNDLEDGFQGTPFDGVLDGNQHTISNLTIIGSGHVGLFGMLESEAVIKNLRVVDCMIAGSHAQVGALAGANGGELSGCHVKGAVKGTECVGGVVGTNLSKGFWDGILIGRITTSHSAGTVSGSDRVGGLAGCNRSRITRCHSTALVTGNRAIGGLVGENNRNITQCYSHATVQADEQGGGLVGKNAGYSGGYGPPSYEAVVSDCYSTVNDNCQVAGLLVGQNGDWMEMEGPGYPSLVTNCYPAGDSPAGVTASGLVGVNIWEQVLNCFWDAEATGIADSNEGGTPKTTAEMQSAKTFYGWGGCGDEPIWTIDEGKNYPRLYWENRPGTVIRPICLADFLAGNGTEEDPFLIHTAEELNLIDLGICDWAKHFKLVADIDLSGHSYTAAVIASRLTTIGPDFDPAEFTGVFDGNGHTISHLTIEGHDSLGFFARLAEGAEVRDLNLVDVNVVGSGNSVGALVGSNAGCLSACSSSGRIRGDWSVGGIAGSHYGGEIRLCSSSAAVTGVSRVGGLVGSNTSAIVMSGSMGTVQGSSDVGGLTGRNSGELLASFSAGTVTGKSDVGGLVGELYGGSVTECYSTGAVGGEEDVGGLVGYTYNGHIDTSYSVGLVSGDEETGGLVGRNLKGVVSQCFWDVQTSGQATSDGGTDLTTAEMKDPFLFGLNGFANDPNWVQDASQDYPRLAWEGTPGQIIPMPDIDWMEGQGTSAEPYYIDTAAQLILLAKASVLWDRHYVLGADIDLDPNLPGRRQFVQAVVPSFSGVFSGNGHTISHMKVAGGDFLGLFGRLSGSINNVRLVDVKIVGSGDYVGGLVGRLHGTITECHSSGTIQGLSYIGGLVGENSGGAVIHCNTRSAVNGYRYVGGLVGYNTRDAAVAACYSVGTVDNGLGLGGLVGYNDGSITASYSAAGVDGYQSLGGLVGGNGGTITASYSTGVVQGTRDYVGGLVGHSSGTIALSHSAGEVRGNSYVGGLVGQNKDGSVFGSYSTGRVIGAGAPGGLVGGGTGTTRACFWDTITSGQADSRGGVGLTTADMQNIATYLAAGWDLTGESGNATCDIWQMLGGEYPSLRHNVNGQLDMPEGLGTVEQPYLIRNPSDLCTIWLDPIAHYRLEAPLDLSGGTWATALVPWFGGVFDGNRHVISNLHIRSSSRYVGLFGYLGSEAEISALGLELLDIEGADGYVGGVAGLNRGHVAACYSTGLVQGDNWNTGGLVGVNSQGTITTSYSSCTVEGHERVGGLVGDNDSGTIGNSYSTGTVGGEEDVGGLVGDNGYQGSIAMSYSTAAVSGEIRAGGLAGAGWSESVTACFWDIESSGRTASAVGAGLPTIEMTTAKTFLDAGWDLMDETANGTEDIWWILEGQDYPRLWWELISAP